MTIVNLAHAEIPSCGAKAGTLGALHRAGVRVPDGFVIPVREYRRHHDAADPPTPARPDADLIEAIDQHLDRLFADVGAGYVAVRSSASDEDGLRSSAAGLHDTFLAVRGTRAVTDATARCWAGLHSARAAAYRLRRTPTDTRPPAMAVLVQRFVDADVSGVLFTQSPRVIEGIRGLGMPLVGGDVTPDCWTLDDTGIFARRPGTATHRLDRREDRLVRTALRREQQQLCLTDRAVHQLDRLGQTITTLLGYDADIEWAYTGNHLHILQARPITAALTGHDGPGQGIPASPGVATGTTCIVLGPRDFHRFRPGDILVCRTIDPAWTPLFSQAAGIVTETGGLLSHAAIVAREVGIPAILSVVGAVARFPDGCTITIDGSTGVIDYAQEALADGS